MFRADYTSRVLDLCVPYLARDPQAGRHNYFDRLGRPALGRFADGWRFPCMELDLSGPKPRNLVTFVYRSESLAAIPAKVSVVGNFEGGYRTIPLQRVGETIYFAVTLPFPFGACYRYLYNVDGVLQMDPVNPQEEKDLDGRVWSRFFCWYCKKRLALNDTQWALLRRFTQHILPFRTEAANEFLANMGGAEDQPPPRTLDALDEQVGVVNGIDKILACQERHLLLDYQICLEQVEMVLRRRNRYEEPAMGNDVSFAGKRDSDGNIVVKGLYREMAENSVPEWNHSRYESPAYFLQMVRRHTIIAAFGHPRYGGNVELGAWRFLEEHFKDDAGDTCFDYRAFAEKYLGGRGDYLG